MAKTLQKPRPGKKIGANKLPKASKGAPGIVKAAVKGARAERKGTGAL
jgi:hypothetical protein